MAKKLRVLVHNEYNNYCNRKLAHYNEWLCNPKRPLGIPYGGFPEDDEFVTERGVGDMNAIESMTEVLTGKAVIPADAKPRGKQRAVKAPKAPVARKAKSGTKQEAAVAIFKRFSGDKTAVISAIMDELSMSTAGATTYYYNAKKLA